MKKALALALVLVLTLVLAIGSVVGLAAETEEKKLWQEFRGENETNEEFIERMGRNHGIALEKDRNNSNLVSKATQKIEVFGYPAGITYSGSYWQITFSELSSVGRKKDVEYEAALDRVYEIIHEAKPYAGKLLYLEYVVSDSSNALERKVLAKDDGEIDKTRDLLPDFQYVWDSMQDLRIPYFEVYAQFEYFTARLRIHAKDLAQGGSRAYFTHTVFTKFTKSLSKEKVPKDIERIWPAPTEEPYTVPGELNIN